MNEEGDCNLGWLILEEILPAFLPNFIYHPGDSGIFVDTNGEAGQGNVVVDGSRNAYAAHGPVSCFVRVAQKREPSERAVSTDDDEAVDSVSRQHLSSLIPRSDLKKALASRLVQHRSAVAQDVVDVVRADRRELLVE